MNVREVEVHKLIPQPFSWHKIKSGVNSGIFHIPGGCRHITLSLIDTGFKPLVSVSFWSVKLFFISLFFLSIGPLPDYPQTTVDKRWPQLLNSLLLDCLFACRQILSFLSTSSSVLLCYGILKNSLL